MNSSIFWFFFVAALVAFIIGLAKGGLGGLLGVLATPLMTLVLPPQQAIGLVLPMLMVSDYIALAFYWKQWNWRYFRIMLPGSIIGVLIGSLILKSAPTRLLEVGLGIFVLLFVLYVLFEKRLAGSRNYQSRDWHGHLAGTLSGFTSALAHTGGPPVTIYLLYQNLTPVEFNATTVIFFLVLNLIKAPFYYFAGLLDFNRLLQIMWVLPLIPLGVWAGLWSSRRIDKKIFEKAILALLVLTGVLLVMS